MTKLGEMLAQDGIKKGKYRRNRNFNTLCLRSTPGGLCEGRMTELAIDDALEAYVEETTEVVSTFSV